MTIVKMLIGRHPDAAGNIQSQALLVLRDRVSKERYSDQLGTFLVSLLPVQVV